MKDAPKYKVVKKDGYLRISDMDGNLIPFEVDLTINSCPDLRHMVNVTVSFIADISELK